VVSMKKRKEKTKKEKKEKMNPRTCWLDKQAPGPSYR
jgi:hypothetical protein